jgi:hypothetical protein
MCLGLSGVGIQHDNVDLFEMFEKSMQVIELGIATGVVTTLDMKNETLLGREGLARTSSPSRSNTFTAFRSESSIGVLPLTLDTVSKPTRIYMKKDILD